MKKIITGLVLGGLLITLFFPMIALSQAEEVPTKCTMDYGFANCPAVGQDCPFDSTTYDCSICCMLNSITTATNWIFYIVTLIAVIMIVIGGFTYVTAAGDPEKAGKARQIIVYAVVGLIVAVVAKLVPGIVRFFVGF